MKQCCPIMESHITKDHSYINYESDCRTYSLELKKDSHGTHQIINFCPWCGSKLPSDLGDKWFEVLEEEFKIQDPLDDDEAKVPSEFHTDEWWKKRGL